MSTRIPLNVEREFDSSFSYGDSAGALELGPGLMKEKSLHLMPVLIRNSKKAAGWSLCSIVILDNFLNILSLLLALPGQVLCLQMKVRSKRRGEKATRQQSCPAVCLKRPGVAPRMWLSC